MTVITLTTVGFREVGTLGEAGRFWTMGLAVAGVGLIFGTVGIVAEYVVTGASSGARVARRMRRSVDETRDHFVLCGYGRVGTVVARELAHRRIPVVVIDLHAESLERARTDGHLVVEGDATDDATLRSAGVERARGLITMIDSDANNVYVILSARAMNPRLIVVGRASTPDAESKLVRAGADRVVSPYTMAGRRLAELAIRPQVVDFLDAALSHGELAFSLEEVVVSGEGGLGERSVADLRRDGVFTLAIVREPGDYEANPPDERRLRPGETLIVSGPAAILEALRTRA
jgi:voltage-gated potassium channel